MSYLAVRDRFSAGIVLNPRDFGRLAEFIEAYSGIRMPPVKRSLVEGRLRRRVQGLGFHSFGDYCDHLFDQGGLDEECPHLIDCITTNKTDFFREPQHFDHLVRVAVPSLKETAEGRPLRLWSAASSIGAEAYTMAISLREAGFENQGLGFDIVGTDICTESLAQACRAIYPAAMMEPVPHEYRRRYFLRSRNGTAAATVRLRPEIRRQVRFGRLNLMDATYPVGTMDIVFCRNILIYFERSTQQAVLRKICTLLRPGGYLYIGHGESATGMDLPVTPVAPSVFRRD